MALVLADRVQETTTSTGTGSVTLGGAVTGYQTFAAIGNGNTTFYCIADQGGANWEVGIGTYSTTGPTLARTTVLASSNSGSLVNFTAGVKTVFVTYPSEKSVNLDSSGNVSPLGTIASAIWQGTTVGIAYGGTGVTASSGANSVVLRDANVNVSANNFLPGFSTITATGGTTTLTNASTYYQKISGASTQTIKLPDATTCALGQTFVFDSDAAGPVTIVDASSVAVDTVPSGGFSILFVESNSTSAGSWGKYALLPATYDFSTTTADFGGATIIGTTYQGTTVATGYGGTGLTGFGAANYAIYSTSSSALTAGTLPVLAGGTGATTLTGYVKGSGTSALTASSTIPGSDISGNISGNAANVTGTVNVDHGGTGLTAVTQYYVPFGNNSTTLSTSPYYQFDGSTLRVGNQSLLAGATNPIIGQTGSFNSYIQTYIRNSNSGTNASSDFTAYPDNGNDASGWVDMGIASSGFADPTYYPITVANEGYLLMSAPTGSGTSGNLVYATDSTGTANSHQWYVGGFAQAKSAYKMQLTASYLELKTPIYATGSTGTSGQVLTSAGSGAAPTWTSGSGASLDQAYFLSFMMG